MRKILFLLILVGFIVGSTVMFSAEKEKKTTDIYFNVGLNLNFNDANIKIGDNGDENSLVYSYLTLEFDVDLTDDLTLGIIAGFNNNYLKETMDFFQLPITLRFNKEKNNSMVFGLNAKSEFLLIGDFSLQVRGEFLYFKLFKKEFPIDLPIATGASTLKNSFSQISLEMLGQYDGFSNFSVFAGPQFNFINGKYTVSETIENIEAEEVLKYKQRKTVGLMAGINYDLGSHFILDLRLTIISKTSFSGSIFYVF